MPNRPVDTARQRDGQRRPGWAGHPNAGRLVDVDRQGSGLRRPAVAPEHFAAEHALAALAGRQHGRIGVEQLHALGIGGDAIDYRVRLGRLHQVHRGVYAVGGSPETPSARWMAATLAGGPGSMLGYLSAGGLWVVRKDPRARCDVIVEGAARRHRDSGIVAHRMRNVHPDDRAVKDGIPVTSLALTLLHLAGLLSRPSVERCVIRAARMPEFDVTEALALCERSTGRRGVRTLRQIVSRDLTTELRTLSELELRFLQLCRRFGTPEPEVNRDVEALMVDAVWHSERVVVELDGFEFHKLPRDLRRDNARNRMLVLAGYKVVRFVWADVVNDSAETAQVVRELLNLPLRR